MYCVNEARWKSGVLRTSFRGAFWCMWAKWAARQYSWLAHEGLRLINWFRLKKSIFIKNQVPLRTVNIVYINNPGVLKGELVHITTLAMNTNFNFTCWQFRPTWDMYILLTSLIMVRFWCGLHHLKALDRLFQMVRLDVETLQEFINIKY